MEQGTAHATRPRARSDATATATASASASPASAAALPRRRRAILIVGDDDALRQRLAAALGTAGYQCTACGWPDVALQLDALRPHALVAEIELGSAAAMERFAALRAATPHAAVPAIALADVADAATIDRAAALGVTEILPLGVTPALVRHRLGHLLRVHELLRGWRASDARRRGIAQAMPDTLLRVDTHGTIREIIAVGKSAHGLALDAHGVGRRLDDLLPVPSDCSFAELCAGVLGRRTAAERQLLRSDGDSVTVLDFRAVPLGEGHCLAVLRDISDRHGFDTGTRRALHYDSLTGLPNRARFMSSLEETLGDGPPPASSIAVLRVQVDQFRRIEQSLGPAAADELLAEVGRRLIGLTEDAGDPLTQLPGRLAAAARLHQEAFAVVAVGLRGRSACDGLAERIRTELARPVSINGREVRSSVSIGISVWPENGSDPETLLRNAALAANHARADGTARLYTDTMRLRSLRSLDIEQHLQRALERNELSLQYQPKVDVGQRRLIGFEALLRWEATALGRVSPAEIIPVAEQCGLILPLGAWVMRQACADARRFGDATEEPLTVAINVSAGQFAGGDLAATARAAVDETGVSAAFVELELTESVLMQDVANALRIFNELRDSGFRLSIDDFGTGYSSLQYLRRLPVNALKIDRSFVKDIADDKSANAICSAVVGLGQSLGLEVIAEGVETVEQANALRVRGCTRLQGYLIGRPMPASSVAGWIARGEWLRAIDRADPPLSADY
jgi:diguanylate cyclase (GGDEF)-like protein